MRPRLLPSSPVPRSAQAGPLILLGALVVGMLVMVVLGGLALRSDLRTQESARSLGETTDAAVGGSRFSLVDFEVQSVFNRWLGNVGAFLTGRDEGGAGADATVQRYFDLRAEIADARAAGRPAGALLALEAEREALENRVERILEDRVASQMRAFGFSRGLPLFDGQALLWPPVDVELTTPPRAC